MRNPSSRRKGSNINTERRPGRVGSQQRESSAFLDWRVAVVAVVSWGEKMTQKPGLERLRFSKGCLHGRKSLDNCLVTMKKYDKFRDLQQELCT